MVATRMERADEADLSLGRKLLLVNWGFVLLVCLIAIVGVAMLYSAGGGWDPWAGRQLIRFVLGFSIMLAASLIDIRTYLRFAYVFYFSSLLLLIIVELMGKIGMGAQRWISVGGAFVVQPSEIMKIAVVLALARYFHGLTPEQIRRIIFLIPPVLIILVPVCLVLLQPNLGTSMLIALEGAAILFVAGVRLWKFVVCGLLGLAAVPIGWEFLRDYQRRRVLTFLDPETDPLGAGYNIIQSKIALGSGGVFGKGFSQGTQNQLMFLPEKHTDFIFVVLSEELGMVGALSLLFLFALLIVYGFAIALSARTQFHRLVAMGLTTSFFLYVWANVAMVTGLIPVVGIPLPLVSYGGTAMITMMTGCGILISVSVHREVRVPRFGLAD